MPIYKTRLYLTNPIHCNHPERNPGKANYHCQLFEGTDNKTSCDDFAIMCIFSSNKPGSCFQVGDFHRQGLPSCDFHLLITRSISPRFIVSLQYLNHEITHMQSDRVQLINQLINQLWIDVCCSTLMAYFWSKFPISMVLPFLYKIFRDLKENYHRNVAAIYVIFF